MHIAIAAVLLSLLIQIAITVRYSLNGGEMTWWMFPALLLMFIPCSMFNHYSRNTWFCSFWGWHKAPVKQGFDGLSLNGECPRCGEKVLQDGQGNWF